LIDDFRSAAHRGSYWGITTSVADYQLADALAGVPEATSYLSSMRTRLNPFTDAEQCRLINGGYALCDAAMRTYVIPGAGPALDGRILSSAWTGRSRRPRPWRPPRAGTSHREKPHR